MKKIVRVSFILFLLSTDPNYAKSVFVEARDAQQIQEILSKEILDDAVVVFDVDVVLMILDVYAFSNCSYQLGLGKRLNDKILRACKGLKDSEEYKALISQVLHDTILVNSKIPGIISDLQKKGVKVMAHTTREIGSYGDIDRQEDLVIEQLKNLGIDFSKAFDEEEIVIDNVKEKKGETYPLFKKGVLFSGRAYEKGEAQKAFHEKIKWIPKHMVFIDDWDKNLHSIENSMNPMGVLVTSIHYTEVEHRKCTKDSHKAKMAEFQVDQLIKTKKWIKDKEADKLLTKSVYRAN